MDLRRYRMIQRVILSLLILAASAAASAGGLVDADRKVRHYAWRTVSMEMSPEEYRDASRANRHFLRHFFNTQTSAVLQSMSVPETGMRMLGAVAALTLDHDAKLYLNKSRTLVLNLADVADDRRALRLGFKLEW